MRALLSTLLVVSFVGLLPMSAAADTSADRDDIIRIISAQMEAFQRDDGVEAFSYASPGIRSMFGTTDRFMRMVIQGYMPVYRPQSVEFLELIETDSGTVQKVKVIDPNGRPVMASTPWNASQMAPGGSAYACYSPWTVAPPEPPAAK